MVPYGISGKIAEIVPKGEYTINEIIAKIETKEGIKEITMAQKWPARKQRPYRQRLAVNELLQTGQRVVDSVFPITKGGTAMLPRRIWNRKNNVTTSTSKMV